MGSYEAVGYPVGMVMNHLLILSDDDGTSNSSKIIIANKEYELTVFVTNSSSL